MNISKKTRAFAFSLIIALPASVLPQRAIVNPSFESPVIPANNYRQVNKDSINGWETSHPQNSGCTLGTNPCRPIEYWRQVFNGVSAATGLGQQWAEINSFTNSMIYQKVCLVSGEAIGYSFVHRGRASSTAADVMQFRIGIPGGLPAGSEPADSYSYTVVQVSTTNNGTVTSPPTGSGTINAPSSAGNGWVRYSGSYTYPGTSRVANIGFVAISTGGGNLSIGNFIDGWNLSLLPFFELNAPAGADPEGTVLGGGSVNPANGPSVRVSGTVTSTLTVRVAVTGGTAIAGEDYSLTSTFQSGNSTTFVDIVVPAGTYDGSTTGVFPVPFAVSADNDPELDETVDFSVSLLGGSALMSGIDSCGTTAISSSTYTIENDDIVTAADAEIAGIVTDEYDRPIPGARLSLTGSDGSIATAVTNPFGRFRFSGVETGVTYVIEASSKSFTFSPVLLTVNESVAGLKIVGGSGGRGFRKK